MAKIRAHVMLPEELIDEVDELVGKRQRSHFVAEVSNCECAMNVC